MPEPMVSVYYYTCNCDWLSKYCDEHHTATATLPLSVLEQYTVV